MTKLSVNVNKVATLRNTRPHLGIPGVVRAATLALDAGAHGITVHPRPDERHIKPHDVDDLAELLKAYPGAEYNIEGNPFHNFIPHIRRVRPDQATLVPDDLAQSTSDHGWDLAKDADRLKPVIAELKSLDVRVSLFMDPDPDQMPLAGQLGADRVELYTEPYATAFASGHLVPIDQLQGRPLGRVLTKMGKVTREQVVEALTVQKQKTGTPVGRILVDLGYAAPTDIETALAAQRGHAPSHPPSASAATEAAAPYAAAAKAAHAAGLGVNAGHDLNLHNLGPFLRAVPHVAEVSIGHALIADALELGLPRTVESYLKLCKHAAP